MTALGLKRTMFRLRLCLSVEGFSSERENLPGGPDFPAFSFLEWWSRHDLLTCGGLAEITGCRSEAELSTGTATTRAKIASAKTFGRLIEGEPCNWAKRRAAAGFLANERSHIMPSHQDKIAETEKKIGDATQQVQDEFAKSFEEISRAVMSHATAEIELGVKLTQKLGAARSFPDVVSAYQEWLSEAMNSRSEDARQFIANSQKLITASHLERKFATL